jgi:hypothetical protein
MPKKSTKQASTLGLPVVNKRACSDHEGLVIEQIHEDVHEILKIAFSKGSTISSQKTALKKYQHILEKDANTNPIQLEKTLEFLTSLFFLSVTPTSIQELVTTILALFDSQLQVSKLKPKLEDFIASLTPKYEHNQLLILEIIFNSPCIPLIYDHIDVILTYFTNLFKIYGNHFANFANTNNFNDIVKEVQKFPRNF